MGTKIKLLRNAEGLEDSKCVQVIKMVSIPAKYSISQKRLWVLSLNF